MHVCGPICPVTTRAEERVHINFRSAPRGMSLNQNKQALFGTKSAGGPKPTATGGSNKTLQPPAAPVPVTVTAPVAAAPVSRTAGMTLKPTATTSSGAIKLSVEEKRKKMDEAREASEKGMNALKTSFFQWSPDHLCASMYFEKSANLYKAADELKQAILMMLKAAESHEASGVLASAALAQTKAAEWALEKGNVPKAVEFYEKAADTWGLHGDLQKYGETLIKVGKECEAIDVKRAKDIYFKGLEVLCPKSTPKGSLRQCHPIIVDILRNLFSFLVREKFYHEAIDIAERIALVSEAFDIESNMCKAMASITVLQLVMGDVVRAQQTYLQEHLSNSQYIKSKECELMDILVMGCYQQDMELLDKAKMHPQLYFLDPEIQKLVKNLSIFGFEDETIASAAAEQPKVATAFAPVSSFAASAVDPNTKSALFATKNTPSSSKKSAETSSLPKPVVPSNSSRRTPPPPPPAIEQEPQSDELNVDDLDNALKDLDMGNDEELREEVVSTSVAAPSTAAPPAANCEDDELDLS